MYDPPDSEHYVEVRSEDGSKLLPNFRSTLRLSRKEKGLFTIVQLDFWTKDGSRKFRGDFRFNYLSLFAVEYTTSKEQLVEKLEDMDLSNDEKPQLPSPVTPSTKLILTYDFQLATNSKIATDPEFNQLLEHLKPSKQLHLVYKANEYFTSQVKAAVDDLLRQAKDDPLNQYYTNGIPNYDPNCMGNMSKLQNKKIPARYKFQGKKDWQTTIAGGAHGEQKRIDEKVQHFCDREHRMVAVRIAGCEDREYLVFFPPLLKDDHKIQAGDKMKILLPGRKDLNAAWTAIVSLPAPQITPEGYLTAYLRRPEKERRDGSTERCFDDYEVKSLPANQTNLMQHLIDKKEGMQVRAFIAVNSILHRRRMACMQAIYKNQLTDPIISTILEVLAGRSFHDLPRGNILDTIMSEYDGHPERFLTGFNAEQKMALELCLDAPARLVLVQGPPGTGKSYFIVQIASLYAMCKGAHKILITTQTNVGTDHLADLCEAMITKLQEQYPERPWLKQKYVVRANVNNVETQIYARRFAPNSKNIPRTATEHKPTPGAQDALDNLSIVRDIATHYLQHQNSVSGSESRKQIPNVGSSLGVKMLEMAGVIDTGPKGENLESYSDFRKHFDSWLKDEDMKIDDLESFWEAAEGLRNYVLQNATVVCTTVTNAGSEIIRNNLRGNTDLIIIDEMPRCLEADALMVLASTICPRGYIMVGDSYQLGPYVESEESENSFAPQMEISIQERFQETGFQYVLFREQHRSDPRLSIDISDLIYDSQLKNHPSTLDRESATKLTEFNLEKFGLATNKLLLDIPEVAGRLTSTTNLSVHMSRYNEDHVIYAINLAEELTTKFPTATIGILTGYAAQYSRMLSAKQSMKFRGGSYEMISVHKIDTVQGLEFDFVILDHLFLKRGSAGFMRDKRRLNVSASRSRHGMYILADVEAYRLLRTPNRDNTFVHAFMRRWLEHSYRVDTTGLVSRYFSGGQVDSKTSETLRM